MINSIHLPKGKLSIIVGMLVFLTIIVFPVYAEVKPTDKGTINVSFSTDPANPNPGDQAYLQISFINKQTNTVQQHIDYKVAVMEGSNQVFGIPITHTAEGSVRIPAQFNDAGTYQIVIEVDGILFQPIPPETATFTVTVGSSNQPSACGPISIPQWVKKNAGWWSTGKIDDSTFAQGIQYLIKQGIIKIPPTHSQGTSSSQVIPQWVKKNAGWWSTGQIDDCTFVQGIQYMIQNGIIKV